MWGRVQSIEDERDIPFDPHKITTRLQETILGYIDSPPRNELGETRWLVLLKYRQAGASTTAASGFYVQSQFHAGWEHVTTADTKERADYLFQRVNYLDTRWPEELKVPQRHHGQMRSFQWGNSSKMIVRSGGGRGMGIGMSASSWHWSELPFWKDAAGQWSYALPAMQNRREMLFVNEFTPSPLSEPSAAFAMELCDIARRGDSRFIYSFQPYWDGKKNARPWPKGSAVTTEEQRLLDRFGPSGLKLENLAFRRYMMEADSSIKRNPDLFRIFYPFDDLTCWMHGSGGVIHARHIERHLTGLVEWDSSKELMVYEGPKEGAVYVIGLDPSGYGARDHASFQVLEVWASSWRQVATFASKADPPEVAKQVDKIGRHYNDALVFVESNGVGLGTIALLQAMDYPNLFYSSRGKPGYHKTDESKLLGELVDALNETLVLRDRETVSQLRSYRSDRALEPSPEAEVLGMQAKGRRERHHWDRVSALMMAVLAAKVSHQPVAPEEALDVSNVKLLGDMTINDLIRYERRKREWEASRKPRGKSRYRSVRKP